MKLLLLCSLASAVLFSGRAFAASDDDTRKAKNQARHDAFDACMTETGVTKPARGQRPSEEDRTKMDTCMTAKGFEGPPQHPEGEEGAHHGRHHGPPPSEEGADLGTSSSAVSSGAGAGGSGGGGAQ